jgi:CHAT domain-containing protein
LRKVSQVETLMLLTLFYREIGAQKAGTSIAKAWQHAQITLYNMSKREGLDFLNQIMSDWDYAEQAGIPVESFLRDGKRRLLRLIQDEEDEWGEQPFRNPYYWASFSLIGHAGTSLRWHSPSLTGSLESLQIGQVDQ